MFKYFRLRLTVVCLCIGVLSCQNRRSVISVPDKGSSRSGKEAILVVPGFGSKIFGNEQQRKFFCNKGYDVFIPKYISRRSVKKCAQNLEEFISKNKLNEYKSLHVFSYIVGSWSVNSYILSHPK